MKHSEALVQFEELAYEDLLLLTPDLPRLTYQDYSNGAFTDNQYYGISDRGYYVTWLAVEVASTTPLDLVTQLLKAEILGNEVVRGEILCAGLHYWDTNSKSWKVVQILTPILPQT